MRNFVCGQERFAFVWIVPFRGLNKVSLLAKHVLRASDLYLLAVFE
jgi:hypothetical protein